MVIQISVSFPDKKNIESGAVVFGLEILQLYICILRVSHFKTRQLAGLV